MLMEEDELLKKKKKGRELEKDSEEDSGLFEELDLDLGSDLPVREKQSKGEKKVRKVRE